MQSKIIQLFFLLFTLCYTIDITFYTMCKYNKDRKTICKSQQNVSLKMLSKKYIIDQQTALILSRKVRRPDCKITYQLRDRRYIYEVYLFYIYMTASA